MQGNLIGPPVTIINSKKIYFSHLTYNFLCAKYIWKQVVLMLDEWKSQNSTSDDHSTNWVEHLLNQKLKTGYSYNTLRSEE